MINTKNNMKKLYLDDFRMPVDSFNYTGNIIYNEKDWVIVRNYDEFCEAIKSNDFELISLDHDLADEHYRDSMYDPDEHYSSYYDDGTFTEKTGYDCARWLVEHCMNEDKGLPEFLVHSMNPIGKKNIIGLLSNFQKFRKGI